MVEKRDVSGMEERCKGVHSFSKPEPTQATLVIIGFSCSQTVLAALGLYWHCFMPLVSQSRGCKILS